MSQRTLIYVALALALACVAVLVAGVWEGRRQSAQAAARADGHALYWKHRRTDHHHEAHELLDQLAERAESPARVLDALGLSAGMVAVDLGCGSGFYSLEMARRVGPGGRVWALDIQQESLDFLAERLTAVACEGCAEVRPVLNSADAIPLDPQSVDAVLMSHLDFYAYRPMLADSERLLGSVHQALRPDGRVVVVQFLPAVPLGHSDHIPANFADAGFVVEERWGSAQVVGFVFRKAGEAALSGGQER